MAETTGTSWLEIKVIDRLGAGDLAQSTDAAFTAGNLVKRGSDGRLQDASITEAAIGAAVPYVTLTDGATVTWDTGSKPLSNAVLTMNHTTGTRTLTLTNLVAGAYGTLLVRQDSTGGANLTFGNSSRVINGGAGAVTITPTASAIDVLAWTYDGLTLFWTWGPNYT